MLEHSTLKKQKKKKKKANFYQSEGFKIQVILLSKKRFYKKSIYYIKVGMTDSELYLHECPT